MNTPDERTESLQSFSVSHFISLRRYPQNECSNYLNMEFDIQCRTRLEHNIFHLAYEM